MIANKLKRWFIYRVLHVDDTPHRIALGVAVGIFITWTPSIGFQMLLTVAISTLLRANKFVGVPFVWISNPLTLVPIYGPNFLLGAWLLGGDYSYDRFADSLAHAVSFGGTWWERIQSWWEATIHFFWPLWIGSVINALVLGVITYVLIYWGVTAYRKRRPLPGRRREAPRRDAASDNAPPATTGAIPDESASDQPPTSEAEAGPPVDDGR